MTPSQQPPASAAEAAEEIIDYFMSDGSFDKCWTREKSVAFVAEKFAALTQQRDEELADLQDRLDAIMGKLLNNEPRDVAEWVERINGGEDVATVITEAVSEHKAFYNHSCEFREQDARTYRDELSALRLERERLRAVLNGTTSAGTSARMTLANNIANAASMLDCATAVVGADRVTCRTLADVLRLHEGAIRDALTSPAPSAPAASEKPFPRYFKTHHLETADGSLGYVRYDHERQGVCVYSDGRETICQASLSDALAGPPFWTELTSDEAAKLIAAPSAESEPAKPAEPSEGPRSH